MPLISASLDNWSKEDIERGEPLHFTFKKIAYWSGYRQLESERAPLWIGFILPESDLFGQVQERQELLTILFIIILKE